MNIRSKFPPGYIDQVFAVWYSAGKPSASNLYRSVPEYEFNQEKPSLIMLKTWMKDSEWVDRTELLDSESRAKLNEKLILSKVEMLERHGEIGREMQRLSLDWLRDGDNDLSAGTAVRMLVDGITIEQEVAGIPEALKKMLSLSDEDLIKEIAQSIADTPDADN